MSKRLVCICNMVTEKEIHSAILKGGRSTSDIQKLTGAGTSCGRCLTTIDSIVEAFLSELPSDAQQKINFGD